MTSTGFMNYVEAILLIVSCQKFELYLGTNYIKNNQLASKIKLCYFTCSYLNFKCEDLY